ncbi:hypothetical protein ACFLW9_00415 [Chloroflexota bacterium]
MKRLVIFCGAYTTIETTLYLVTHNWCHRPVTIVIIGTLTDLYKFFQIINEKLFNNKINIIHFKGYQPRRARANKIKRLLYLLPDIVKEKQYLKKLFDKNFAGLKEAEVYFSGKGSGTRIFYLLKKLCKANRLVYMHCPGEELTIEEFTPTNLIDFADLIINKIIYGFEIVMGRLPYTHFPCIPDKFLKREVAETIDHTARNEMLRDFDLNRFKEIFAFDNEYRVIYFHQDLVDGGYVPDRDTFKRELTEIFNVLSKYFLENEVAIKHHPSYPGDKTVIEFGEVIDDFIPGEFLYNDKVKMYLSPISAALANVEKGLAVSIADLITFRDDKTRNQLKEHLMRMSRSQIVFPRSLDEFEKLLIGIKEQKFAGG